MNIGFLFHALKVLCLCSTIVAVACATRFLFNTHTPVYDADSTILASPDSVNFAGSVKGRSFPDGDAFGLFFVGGEDLLRFNLDNFSGQTRALTLYVNGEERYTKLPVAPGLTKLEVEVPGGPARLRFFWDSPPDRRFLILTQLPSSDYKIARRAVYIAGGAAWILLLLTIIVRSDRRSNLSPGRRKLEDACAVFALFFAVFFYVHDNALIPLTGDEPHYMILAQSIGEDGDYDVIDDYASALRETYYPGALDPHTVSTNHGVITARYPGLGILLAPVFAGLQFDPYVASKVILILCSANLAAFFFQAIRRFSSSSGFALSAVAASLLSMPFLAYSNQIYPETAGALLLFLIVLRIWEANVARRASVLTAVLIVLLPVVNLKFNAAAFLCGLALLWRYRRQGRALVAPVAVLVIGAAGAAAFAWFVYGDVLKGPYKDHSIVIQDFGARYLTYLVDADRGLFALNPLFLFFFPGLLVLYKKDRVLALLTLGLVALTNLSGIFQREESHWLLGYCPTGRYWISVVPVMGWVAARGWFALWRDASLPARVFLAAFSALAAFVALLQSLAFVHFQEGFYLPLKETLNAARFFAQVTGVDLSPFFASYPFADFVPAAAWAAMLVLFAVAQAFRIPRSAPPDRRSE